MMLSSTTITTTSIEKFVSHFLILRRPEIVGCFLKLHELVRLAESRIVREDFYVTEIFM